MLWLWLPWSAFSVVRGYAPLAAIPVFLRMDIPELIAMGDRREMVEYGRRFYPMQSRDEQGMLGIKWPASMVSLSDVGEAYLYNFLGAGGYEIGTHVVGGKTFRAYDFPRVIDDFLIGDVEIDIEDFLTVRVEVDIEGGQPPILTPAIPGGWCEAQLDVQGDTRWRWGSDYPQSVFPSWPGIPSDFLEFMQQQTPFIDDTALLGLLGLEEWPTGGERWIRRWSEPSSSEA